MRKSTDLKSHYRPGTSRGSLSLVTFREQMTDFARGDRLLELRAKKRMSREDVAHAIGVTTKSLYTWEKKNSGIKSDNAKQLAKFYDVPNWEDLVTRDPEATGPSSRGQVGEGFKEFRDHVADIRADIATANESASEERESIRAMLATQTGILDKIMGLLAQQDEILRQLTRVAGSLPDDDALKMWNEGSQDVLAAAEALRAARSASEAAQAGTPRRRAASE